MGDPGTLAKDWEHESTLIWAWVWRLDLVSCMGSKVLTYVAHSLGMFARVLDF